MLAVDILGLPIPDAGPIFATALAVHVACGLTARVAGALAATCAGFIAAPPHRVLLTFGRPTDYRAPRGSCA